MQQEVNVQIFLIHAQEGQFETKTQVRLFFCFLLGFTCLSFNVRCVEDMACNFFHNNFTKKNERFNLYMFNVIYT